MKIETPLAEILANRKGFAIDVGSHSAVILIHGIGGTAAGNRPLGEYLAARNGLDVIGICLPGHATQPEDLSSVAYVDWVNAVVASYKKAKETHDKVYVVGGSLGGLLALALGEKERPDKIVTFSGPLYYKHPIVKAAGLLSHFKKYHVWKEYKNTTLEDKEKAKLVSYDRLPFRAIEEMNRLQKEVKKGLPFIKCPVEAIYGADDVLVNQRKSMRVLRKKLTVKPEMKLLPDTGHTMLWGLTKDEVFALISSYLQ